MNKHMVSQHVAIPVAQARSYLGREVNERKDSTSVSSDNCSLCRGTKRLRITAPYGDFALGRSVTCSCAEVQHAPFQRRRHTAKMDELCERTFEAFNLQFLGNGAAFRACVAYATKHQGRLLLVCPCGCEKTYGAAAIANQQLEYGYCVFFVSVPNLLAEAPSTFVTMERDRQFLAWVSEGELLVLGERLNSSLSDAQFVTRVGWKHIRDFRLPKQLGRRA